MATWETLERADTTWKDLEGVTWAELEEVCEKASSNIAQKDLETRDGEYPIYGASGFIKNVDFYQQETPYIAVVKDGAGVGRVMRLPAKSSVIGTMQYILPKNNVDTGYLAYALERMNLSKYYTGATIPHIYFKDYKTEKFPLPSLDEQRRIAALLDRVSDLIAKRRAQLDKLDLLVKARFVEMFGDPVKNDKGLPTMMGQNFFKLSNGKFVPENKRLDSGIPAYGGNGVSWCTDEILCKENTIVVGRVGFQSGNVHFVKGPLWITDNAMYISNYNTRKYDLFFLYVLMEHIDFTRFQDAGDLKKITQKPFMSMEYIMPTLSRQREYVAFAKQIDKSKLTLQQSLDKLETLKKALMQQYFG